MKNAVTTLKFDTANTEQSLDTAHGHATPDWCCAWLGAAFRFAIASPQGCLLPVRLLLPSSRSPCPLSVGSEGRVRLRFG
jgi:hypothetical protein